MTPELELLRAEIAELRAALPAERWLDRAELAEHFSCSVRSIATALAEGMPHAIIFGRPKFRVSETEVWLEEHGYLRRAGDGRRIAAIGSENGAAPLPRPAPGHGEDGPHGK